ncbi:MAG TPA: LPXTG cell wall anchor domain-containing protein [Pyrinomonadaceae bacterium]
MKAKMMTLSRAFALLGILVAGSLAIPAAAQNSGGSQTTGSTGAQSTQSTTTTTTKSVEPAQTTTTTTKSTGGIDPLWLILGGIGVVALLAIVLLSSRRRSRDTATVVHERETVIKK